VGRIAIFILKRALYERNALISFQIYGMLKTEVLHGEN